MRSELQVAHVMTLVTSIISLSGLVNSSDHVLSQKTKKKILNKKHYLMHENRSKLVIFGRSGVIGRPPSGTIQVPSRVAFRSYPGTVQLFCPVPSAVRHRQAQL